ncbi:2-oxoacid:ferredoxin oxidoreductase subunit beta [Weeksellaceae bacterium KMM 9713]|uniref:2-oxoacid:ferredoxin oxidoreductase subunit beta n=1 Tax=Profundicola chukchiensis TaxID=2961959 RepID=A0A9X4N0H9_9FLAO|nr:2-oxoacid:ferredoxin oxidoreductase subunit beta [Profundicola chukchiensis]MDG4946061.1 2-oxoacid:ferredoxin oxidoreductase subunit beta [Profundicola chukchiensis]
MTQVLTSKDFVSDQDIKWCPGCGDYSILKQMQSVLPELGLDKEDIVFISGIGCSSRFPYYMDTYGMHSIHGRAPAVASGTKIANPDLHVWVITGDGDSLSIGGNHFIHAFRRNIDFNILLFNNEIYGLTKGQYSPTSTQGLKTKSSPYGSVDYPFNPLGVALGADATFVARSMDRDPAHLREMMRRTAEHKGTSLLEVYQNCPIFNDGIFEEFTDKKKRSANAIYIEHGQPMIFGAEEELGLVLDGTTPRVVKYKELGMSADDLWIHDEQDITKAQILSHLFDDPKETEFPRPFGVLYSIERKTYEELLFEQLNHVMESNPSPKLDDILAGKNTWQVN